MANRVTLLLEADSFKTFSVRYREVLSEEISIAKGNSQQYWQALTRNIVRSTCGKRELGKGDMCRLNISLDWYSRSLLAPEYHAALMHSIIHGIRYRAVTVADSHCRTKSNLFWSAKVDFGRSAPIGVREASAHHSHQHLASGAGNNQGSDQSSDWRIVEELVFRVMLIEDHNKSHSMTFLRLVLLALAFSIGTRANDSYRSRFHPDYLAGNLDRFYKLRPSVGQPASIGDLLSVCSILLPYRHKNALRLSEAHKWKTDMMNRLWEMKRKKLLKDGHLSRKFVTTILVNLLGAEAELWKIALDSESDSGDSESESSDELASRLDSGMGGGVLSLRKWAEVGESVQAEEWIEAERWASAERRDNAEKLVNARFEPAYDIFVSTQLEFLAKLYAKCPVDSILWMELHSETTICTLAKLLYSPDHRERTAISNLFIKTSNNLMSMQRLGRQNGSKALLVMAELVDEMGKSLWVVPGFMVSRAAPHLIKFSSE
ncbi:hypothetical protein PSACC_01859 [Paramicrosporidium saccamoebae]|uniref:Uncharacterized protein n=1 Tax=Paramicrosporidium saccamoebae TaxID=1246581 RepID=A0A2H9TKN6_9FUNG|nr:hypothetical protein PSACC_01859 [Paramicrosporidium saccamoebae]